jgi:hypothetical protein
MTGIEMENEKLLILIQIEGTGLDQVRVVNSFKGAFQRFCWFVNSILGIHDSIRWNRMISDWVGIWRDIRIYHFPFELFLTAGGKRSCGVNGSLVTQIGFEDLGQRNDQTNCRVISNQYFQLRLFDFLCPESEAADWRVGMGVGRSRKRYFPKKEEENSFFDCNGSGFIQDVYQFRRVLGQCGGSRRVSGSGSLLRDSTHVIEIDDSYERIRPREFENQKSLRKIVFSKQSRVKVISGFGGCSSLLRIEIPSSVERIGDDGFKGCTSLNEIIFSPDSHLKHISGFSECSSLLRIEIPSSVETVLDDGFKRCTSLNEIIFSSDSHLKEISGFGECSSLLRIQLPSSVKDVSGIFRCRSLRLVIFHAGCRVQLSERFRIIRPFLVYDDVNVKASRRQFHLGTFSLGLYTRIL